MSENLKNPNSYSEAYKQLASTLARLTNDPTRDIMAPIIYEYDGSYYNLYEKCTDPEDGQDLTYHIERLTTTSDGDLYANRKYFSLLADTSEVACTVCVYNGRREGFSKESRLLSEEGVLQLNSIFSGDGLQITEPKLLDKIMKKHNKYVGFFYNNNPKPGIFGLMGALAIFSRQNPKKSKT